MARLHGSSRSSLGYWRGQDPELLTDPQELHERLAAVSEAFHLVERGGALAVARGGVVEFGASAEAAGADALPLLAMVPACHPRDLGDPTFAADHKLAYNYVVGAMANGIASAELVETVGRAGLLGFFGAAGLAPDEVEDAVVRISSRLGSRSWGANLIHSPSEPEIEARVAQLYLRRGVTKVSASAYLDLTLPILRYRYTGIRTDSAGRIRTPNAVFAKVSRVEVARKFMSPAPAKLLAQLVAEGTLDAEQATMAARVPVAADITVEADSGGHTDNRPALTLLPTMLALRDEITSQSLPDASQAPRVGLGGGLATPQSVAAAFAMGAAYVLTGSVNQACREAGTSDAVREMLAQTQQADVTMAPAADMFEMGVKLQVIKRGTMFAMRAQKLYELYRRHRSLAELSAKDRQMLEMQIFRAPLDQAWKSTADFWQKRDPNQLEKAARDERHKMALLFRAYLGQSSRWANAGVEDRRLDYQVWCGPAMGAFNEWTRDSFLADWRQRRAVCIALNLLHGAAHCVRLEGLRRHHVELADGLRGIRPRPLSELEELLA